MEEEYKRHADAEMDRLSREREKRAAEMTAKATKDAAILNLQKRGRTAVEGQVIDLQKVDEEDRKEVEDERKETLRKQATIAKKADYSIRAIRDAEKPEWLEIYRKEVQELRAKIEQHNKVTLENAKAKHDERQSLVARLGRMTKEAKIFEDTVRSRKGEAFTKVIESML